MIIQAIQTFENQIVKILKNLIEKLKPMADLGV